MEIRRLREWGEMGSPWHDWMFYYGQVYGSEVARKFAVEAGWLQEAQSISTRHLPHVNHAPRRLSSMHYKHCNYFSW